MTTITAELPIPSQLGEKLPVSEKESNVNGRKFTVLETSSDTNQAKGMAWATVGLTLKAVSITSGVLATIVLMNFGVAVLVGAPKEIPILTIGGVASAVWATSLVTAQASAVCQANAKHHLGDAAI